MREKLSPPKSLKQLQSDFINMIWRQQASTDNIVQALDAPSRENARHRIYQQTVQNAHIDALLGRFPCLQQLLGDTLVGMARYYFLHTDSVHIDLAQYGERFLQLFVQYPESKIHGLRSLAHCEQALELNYYAQQPAPVSAEHWQSLIESQPLDALFLDFMPSLTVCYIHSAHHAQLLEQHHPYAQIDQTLRRGWMVVYTQGFNACIDNMDAVEAKILRTVQARSYAHSLEQLLRDGIVSLEYLQAWLSKRWLMGLKSKAY